MSEHPIPEFKSFISESRKSYGMSQDRPLTTEELAAGAMLRMADALEKIALNHSGLIEERNYYKRACEKDLSLIQTLKRQITGLKRHITKMNKAKDGGK